MNQCNLLYCVLWVFGFLSYLLTFCVILHFLFNYVTVACAVSPIFLGKRYVPEKCCGYAGAASFPDVGISPEIQRHSFSIEKLGSSRISGYWLYTVAIVNWNGNEAWLPWILHTCKNMAMESEGRNKLQLRCRRQEFYYGGSCIQTGAFTNSLFYQVRGLFLHIVCGT